MTTRAALADEFETRTPYYEDDAWYDVSEWLDGNDYNPTDEAIGQWDDERFDASEAGTDADNDTHRGYSQDRNSEDNWFYDNFDNRRSTYYSDANRQDIHAYRWDYFDYDRDGYYDAMISSYDSDNDGSFDRVAYYTFSDGSSTAANQQREHAQDNQNQAAKTSKTMTVTGTIKSAKKVDVRGDAQRWVAQVTTDDGQTRMVDFGPVDELKTEISQGQKVTAHGPLAKAGKHQIVLAHRVNFDNQGEQQINRSGRKLSGKVVKMQRAKIRGDEHQMALLELDSGKQALIDLGNTDSLGVDLSENDRIDVRGVPVKVKDRLVVIANSVTKNGEKTKIQRMASKERQPASL